MTSFEIVAHRGIAAEAPENTLAAFRRAVELGVDAVELDVRLTADRVPVVYHYYYLDEVTTGRGPIFAYTLEQLRDVQVLCKANPAAPPGGIPTLSEVLEQFGEQIGLEIEMKGPEPEAPEIIGSVLRRFARHWPRIEVTSYEPALLQAMHCACPGLATDVLFRLSEPWMKLDVVAYQAAQCARLAGARAVHLHPSQLSMEVVDGLRMQGVEVHSWDVNDEAALETVTALGVHRICTDDFARLRSLRERLVGHAGEGLGLPLSG